MGSHFFTFSVKILYLVFKLISGVSIEFNWFLLAKIPQKLSNFILLLLLTYGQELFLDTWTFQYEWRLAKCSLFLFSFYFFSASCYLCNKGCVVNVFSLEFCMSTIVQSRGLGRRIGGHCSTSVVTSWNRLGRDAQNAT